MSLPLSPPPFEQNLDSFAWKDWFFRLQQYFKYVVFGISNGGTGLTTIGSANSLLGVDSIGSSLEYKQLVAGDSSISIINTNGKITLSASAPRIMEEYYEETNNYTIQGIQQTVGGSGLTHPQVLTRVSFRL